MADLADLLTMQNNTVNNSSGVAYSRQLSSVRESAVALPGSLATFALRILLR